MDKEIMTTTTSASAMSGIPWKKVKKLVNDSIAAGANVDISCEGDGSWNIAIYPPEKQNKITVPDGGGWYPVTSPILYTDDKTTPPFIATCNAEGVSV